MFLGGRIASLDLVTHTPRIKVGGGIMGSPHLIWSSLTCTELTDVHGSPPAASLLPSLLSAPQELEATMGWKQSAD